MKSHTVKKTGIITFLLIFTFILSSISLVPAQAITIKAQPSNPSPNVGSTMTVDSIITNLQNVFDVDIRSSSDPVALKADNATSLLGVESHSGGVLHGTIDYALNQLTQQTYDLAGTSKGAATPAFNRSGKIATLTFTVLRPGQTTITLVSELADKPESNDDIPKPIGHTDVSGSINAAVPEFPTIAGFIVLLILATGSLVFSKKTYEEACLT